MQNSDDGTLGSLLRLSRKEMRMTLASLARLINFSEGYLSRIELNRASRPSDTCLYRLAKALKIDPLELRNRRDQQFGTEKLGSRLSAQRPETGTIVPQTNAVAIPPNAARFTESNDTESIQQDIHDLLTKNEGASDKLSEHYLHLAQRYDQIGEIFIELRQFDNALVAYRAAEVIYKQSGFPIFLQKCWYRFARTYQVLGWEDETPAQRKITYFQRGLEYCDRILFELDTDHNNQDDDQRLLGPSCLAVSGSLTNRLLREVQQQYEDIQSSKRWILKDEIKRLRSLAVVRYFRADKLYSKWLTELKSREDNQDNGAKIADVLFRLGLLHRGMELYKDEKDAAKRSEEKNYSPSISLFYQAIEKYRRLGLGATGEAQSTFRLNLALCHQELGQTYVLTTLKDRFGEAMWQYNIAKRLRGQEHNTRINDLMDSIHQESANEQDYVETIRKIDDLLTEADFSNLLYPNTFGNGSPY